MQHNRYFRCTSAGGVLEFEVNQGQIDDVWMDVTQEFEQNDMWPGSSTIEDGQHIIKYHRNEWAFVRVKWIPMKEKNSLKIKFFGAR